MNQPGLLSRRSDDKNPFRTELDLSSLSLVDGLEKLFALLLVGFAFEVDFVPL